MLRVSVSHMPGCKSVCWAVRWDADHSSCFCVQVYDYPFSMRLHLATTLVFCGYMLFLAGFLAVKVLGPALCVAFGVLSVSCLGYAHLYPELTHTGKNM